MYITAWDEIEVNKIIRILNLNRITARAHNDKEMFEFFDNVLQIVNQWKYDNSQWDFRQDHYRQAVSFLMWIAEETGATENDCPEYFEDRFFNRLKSYKALELRFNERVEKGKKRRR